VQFVMHLYFRYFVYCCTLAAVVPGFCTSQVLFFVTRIAETVYFV
jgi:hypothetical protein